jgi:hypothetical protein
MEPHDDPEARIRELERPLTDVARTSELGATHSGGYAAPPTPPGYGAPYPAGPPRTTAGFGGWWIVLAVLVVGVVVLAGGVAAFGAHLFSNRGSIISSPTNPPGNSRGAGPSVSATAPPGGDLTVTGIGENKALACNDSRVSVTGISNTIVITGHCRSLTVVGSKNTVTVQAADSINASGFDNQVTYHSGSPSISTSGQSNVVGEG